MTSAESIVTILVAIASSGGLWGTLQLWMNRNGRKAEAAKAQSEVEKSNITRAQMLAEAQAFLGGFGFRLLNGKTLQPFEPGMFSLLALRPL